MRLNQLRVSTRARATAPFFVVHRREPRLSGLPLLEGRNMGNEDEITGMVEYRGKKQIYTAYFEADTRDDLIHLFPTNYTGAAPAIKKMPNMSYKETARYQLKKLVDDEIEADGQTIRSKGRGRR